MIITDDFVMLNFPKTGSSFAREALKRLYANRNIIELMLPKITEKRYRDRVDQHGTFRQIPLAHKNKPVLSITRNPLSRFQSTLFPPVCAPLCRARLCGVLFLRRKISR